MTSPHFTSAELACQCCGENDCKQSLLDALELLRAAVGVPIIVDDAYRCAKHNGSVGGVLNSYHTRGMAADIKITGMTPKQMYHAALQVPQFGGIGVAQRYIHVDVRPVIARWCYDVEGEPCAWNPGLDIVA